MAEETRNDDLSDEVRALRAEVAKLNNHRYIVMHDQLLKLGLFQLYRGLAFGLGSVLGATILVHPRSLKDPAVAEAVEQAIADLRYGTVAVNAWVAVAYGAVTTTWGAHPGSTDEDIQSGRGVVHNSRMLEDVEKSVVRAPFKAPIKPPTFHTHTGLVEVGRRLTELEATGDLGGVPSLLWHAMRG